MRGIEIDGDKFRRVLKNLGFTQEGLAHEAKCNETTVRKAERSGRLDLPVVNRLVAILKTDIASIAADGPIGTEQQKNLVVADLWDRAFFARDLEAVMSFHHPEVELVIPSSEGLPGGGHFIGREAVRQQMIESFSIFAKGQQFSRQIHAVGDFVFIRGDASFELAQTGTSFRSYFLNELRFVEGLIIHRTVVADYEGLRRGLEKKQ